MLLPIQKVRAASGRVQPPARLPFARTVTGGMLRVGLAIFVLSTLYIYVVLGDHHILSLDRLRFTAPVCILLGALWGLHSWYEGVGR